MADLDDFFAKKDKKKSKAKPKFLTAEELVKNLEDTSKREAVGKPKKAAEPLVPTIGTTIVSNVSTKIEEGSTTDVPAEEEWKEFEEEQRKDYTGLKIGQLNVNDDDDLSATEGTDEEVDSDGNSNIESGKRSTGGGPWKKVVPAEEVTQIPVEVEKPTSKYYVTPALRQSQQQQGVNVPSRIKGRSRAAPDITNADFFPTLGAARPEEQRKKKNEPAFEEVRHGGRMQRVQEKPNAAPTTATNRFQSLDEDDS